MTINCYLASYAYLSTGLYLAPDLASDNKAHCLSTSTGVCAYV